MSQNNSESRPPSSVLREPSTAYLERIHRLPPLRPIHLQMPIWQRSASTASPAISREAHADRKWWSIAFGAAEGLGANSVLQSNPEETMTMAGDHMT
ncbi:MAG: hypothetical protein ACFCVA_05290 [Gammaproteobacteria bacterium]